MCFSPVIDRQSVSVVIVRGLCDVWNKMNSSTFVTDEQNVFSLCPAEGPVNLVVVRIRYLSVRSMQPHMYPRRSSPSDVKSDMSVKDVVLWCGRQCGTMVDVSQVIIVCIHGSRLTTHVRNELNCSCSCTEILVFLTVKLELLSPLL